MPSPVSDKAEDPSQELAAVPPSLLSAEIQQPHVTGHGSRTESGPDVKLVDAAVQHPVVIEIFAGTARVTACLKHMGFTSSFGVDCDCSKAVSTCRFADLAQPGGQNLCLQWLRCPRLAGIVAAPACGTCSRARELPNGPPPLRSDAEPDGLSSLQGTQLTRVATANATYKFLADVVEELLPRGVIILVENPRRSIFWLTSYWQRVAKFFHYIPCQACAFGGRRPKHTVFAVSHRGFESLSRFCPGPQCEKHHLPWGQSEQGHTGFATSEETAYPPRMAMQIALCFAHRLHQCGWPLKPSSFDASDPRYMALTARAISGEQPKASRIPPLVSEHAHILVIRSSVRIPEPCPFMQRLAKEWRVPEHASCHSPVVPRKAQLLRNTFVPANMGSESGECIPDLGIYELVFGVPWTEDQFIKQAAKAGHPRKLQATTPEPLKHTLAKLSCMSDEQVRHVRISKLKEWVCMASQLETEEQRLKESLHPDVREVVSSKRLLLWEAILKGSSYPDMGVVSEMKAGVQLTGEPDITGLFKPNFRPMDCTPASVRERAKDFRTLVLKSVVSQKGLDGSVMTKTLEERDRGWLVGPFKLDDLPDDAIISRRFGITQGQKVRLIDDFTQSGVNLAVQSYEAPQPQSTDVIASICHSLLESSKINELVGKAFDLSAAYRQVAVAPESAWACYIACFDPELQAPAIFRMRAMPFGAKRAVHGFLRIAYSIWYIGVCGLLLPWSDYFDDFVTFASSESAQATDDAVSLLFRLLGWKHDDKKEKSFNFAKVFTALGISVDLSSFLDGRIFFSNTERRIADIKDLVTSVLSLGSLPHAAALKLRGKLQFANGQLFGRLGKACLTEVTRHAYEAPSEHIDPKCRLALVRFLRRLEKNAGRIIMAFTSSPWYIFTDASYEPPNLGPSICGVGGILVDSSGTPKGCFSSELPPELKSALGEGKSSQIILEAEMLAMLVALSLWHESLEGRPTVFYVDNNSARDILISARARSDVPSKLLEVFLELEEDYSVTTWVARVPSPSNPADAPSRFFREHFTVAGSRIIPQCIIETLKQVSCKIAEIEKRLSRG